MLTEASNRRDRLSDRIDAFNRSRTERAAAPTAAQGDGARDCPPTAASSPEDIGPPVVAACTLGERHGGRLWDTVRWTGNSTLLVGPGVTLTLGAGDVDAIHTALGHAIAARGRA
ncbi:hypothetical protein [Sphingomonas sp. YL-JM2C]